MKSLPLVLAFVASLSSLPQAYAATTIVTVDDQSGPWQWVDGGLNTGYQFGLQDGSGPLVVSSGFDFTAGGTFTFTYLDGLASAYAATAPYSDGEGDTAYVTNDNIGSSFKFFPSAYFDPADYDSYLNSLVGVFTDSTGVIVGTPFEIGNGRTVTVPSGASQVQLGFNDDIFSDNSGALRVKIESSVPDGGATLAFLTGSMGAMMALRRFVRK